MKPLEFEITKGPSIGSKDHVILESLSELRRLCRNFDIPLMHISKPSFYVEKNPTSTLKSVCGLYFACLSGMFYTYIEQDEGTEGVSS